MKIFNSEVSSVNLFIYSALIITIIILSINGCHKQVVEQTDQGKLVAALYDSLTTYKNKDSNNVARISVLETDGANRFTELQIKDREIEGLQTTVKEYSNKLVAGSSVTNGLLETLIELRKKVMTITGKTDTVRGKDNIVYLYPTYRDTAIAGIKKWIDYDIVLNKDSSNVNIKVNNNFSVIIGKEKGKNFADLITDNPYTSTKKLRVYQVQLPKPKRFGLGIIGGYGFNQTFYTGFFIGAGLQYNLIRF